MTREEAKVLLPIIQAFAEGKVIECRTKPSTLSKSWQDMNKWTEMKEIEFWNNIEYRIKPDSKAKAKYRHFANIEEGLQEILKHQPLWYLKSKETWEQYQILDIKINENKVFIKDYGLLYLADVMEYFNFPDGTPFGVKEEE